MTMQASFNRAIAEDAKIAGLTSIVPLNVPQTPQHRGGQAATEKSADSENAANSWYCLAKSLADLPLSCPTRTSPTAENTGDFQAVETDTTESTTTYAKLFASCFHEHLDEAQIRLVISEMSQPLAASASPNAAVGQPSQGEIERH